MQKLNIADDSPSLLTDDQEPNNTAPDLTVPCDMSCRQGRSPKATANLIQGSKRLVHDQSRAGDEEHGGRPHEIPIPRPDTDLHQTPTKSGRRFIVDTLFMLEE